MNALCAFAFLLIANMIGSFPTAVLYSRKLHQADIRRLGDGNMGARNTKHTYGFSAGFIVALIDIFKGSLVVLLANALGFHLEWQLLTGAAVILGHDFPVFASFTGGQGFATTTGVFLALLPAPTLIGFVVFVSLYLLFHNFDIGASFGMGLVALLAYLNHVSGLEVGFIILALLFIPFKKRIDKPRRERIHHENQAR